MYLKSLELAGFKSFPDKTKIDFQLGLTAIVGPNGSGKSNISDAMRWVLGEQSAKTLRVERMEDLIFSGTVVKKQLGYALATITLDNTDNSLKIASDDVTVTRKYYRSGDSEYLLNGKQVRLKDILEIFMDTGMGRDGYSIVGQGKITEIISSKSDERRAVFEEAAGISKFRYKRNESQRNLVKVNDNLVRLNDILAELETRLGPLKEQSDKAKEYLRLAEELKILDISFSVKKLEDLKKSLDDIDEKYLLISAQVETLENEIFDNDSKIENLQGQINSNLADIENMREKLSDFHASITEFTSQIAVFENDIVHAKDRINEDETQLNREIASKDELQAEKLNFENSLAELKKLITEKQAVVDNLLAEYKKIDEIIKNFETDTALTQKQKNIAENIRKIEEDNNNLTVDMRDIDRKIKNLKEWENSLEGFSFAVKNVLNSGTKGVFGSVIQLIEVDNEFVLAIETALGGATSNIVVDNENTAKYCINMLKSKKSGRATFLPVTSINGTETDFSRISNMKGFIGNASDLVRCDRKFDGIIINLLGRILIVETLDDADIIARQNNYRFKIVTLDGQVINAGGSFTGGSNIKSTGILSRKTEIENLQIQLNELRIQRNNNNQKILDLKAESENISLEIENSQIALKQNTEIKNGLVGKIAEAKTEAANVAKDLEMKEILYKTFTVNIENSENRKNTLKDNIKNQNEIIKNREISVAEHRQIIVDIEENIKTQNNKITQFNSKNRELEYEIGSIRQKNKKLENEKETNGREKARIEERKITIQKDIDEIIKNLSENYDVTRSEAAEIAKPIEDMSKAQREINSLRNKIREMGSVNTGAIEEYKEVSERFENMTTQLNDVKKSKNELEKLIDDITNEMKRIFRETFAMINANFKEIFVELFGGGKAELVLEDEENILECGIDINIAPPGKVIKNLMSLSGGEQSFAAICIFFAMLRLKPAPFCVLDEIDAALDDANVRTYAKYLRNFTDKTQFILVTHRRGAMEEADMLYGVTMQEDGISTLLKVNLEDFV